MEKRWTQREEARKQNAEAAWSEADGSLLRLVVTDGIAFCVRIVVVVVVAAAVFACCC